MRKGKLVLSLVILLLFLFGLLFYFNNRDISYSGESENWSAKYKIDKSNMNSLEIRYKNEIKDGEDVKYVCKIVEDGDERARIDDKLTKSDNIITHKSNSTEYSNAKNKKYLIIISWNNNTEKISLYRD